jgi:hypothetical protein
VATGGPTRLLNGKAATPKPNLANKAGVSSHVARMLRIEFLLGIRDYPYFAALGSGRLAGDEALNAC